MSNAAANPYAEQRAQIEALNDLAFEEAVAAIDHARKVRGTDRYQVLMELFRRLKHSVERGAAYLVRLDQALLWIPRQPANTSASPRERAPSEPREPRPEQLPELDRFERLVTGTVRQVVAQVADPEPAEAPQALTPKSQSEIAREALKLRRAAGPAPPLRRTG